LRLKLETKIIKYKLFLLLRVLKSANIFVIELQRFYFTLQEPVKPYNEKVPTAYNKEQFG
jgi:hypothetical protein